MHIQAARKPDGSEKLLIINTSDGPVTLELSDETRLGMLDYVDTATIGRARREARSTVTVQAYTTAVLTFERAT